MYCARTTFNVCAVLSPPQILSPCLPRLPRRREAISCIHQAGGGIDWATLPRRLVPLVIPSRVGGVRLSLAVHSHHTSPPPARRSFPLPLASERESARAVGATTTGKSHSQSHSPHANGSHSFVTIHGTPHHTWEQVLSYLPPVRDGSYSNRVASSFPA